MPGEVLFGVYEAKRKNTQPSLVYCGDDESVSCHSFFARFASRAILIKKAA